MDGTPPDIKHDPSLYPFKRKPMNNPFSCPIKKKPLVQSGNTKNTTIETLLPSFSVMQVSSKNIIRQFYSFINRDWLFRKNAINMGTNLDLGMFMASNKANITFDKPESKNISLGSGTPANIALEKHAFEKPKSVEITPEKANPTEISLATQNSAEIPLPGPKSTEISHGTSRTGVVSPERIPEQVSWTRVDSAQARLDKVPLRLKVAMGVVSGMVATSVVHPLDVVKVRQQLFPKKIGTLTMLSRIIACEGQKGLYTGLTAGLLRQLTYTGSRLYVYNTLVDKYRKEHGRLPTERARVCIAVAAGMVGAFAGTPSEVALVRIIEMQRLRRSSCSPACSPTCKQFPHHAGAITELYKIARREGVWTWWRGGVPTVIRSIFVSSAQVWAYTEIRRAFKHRGHFVGGVKLHVCSAICSSLISATLSLPVDQVKTRYQSYREKQRHVDILKDMLKRKGVKYLWKGFLPYYFRQTIHTVITYVLVDQFIDAYITFKEAGPKD